MLDIELFDKFTEAAGINKNISSVISEFQENKLIRLNLKGRNLSKLPQLISKFENLRTLILDDNNLATLPKDFENLRNLTKLYLAGNNLTNIPESICKLTTLNYLTLNDNQLAVIPQNIANLSNLVYLNLRNNHLLNIPNEVCELSNLFLLDVFNNQVETIPVNIGNLLKLIVLNLSKNKLVYIPNTICKLPNLKSLYLSNNPIPINDDKEDQAKDYCTESDIDYFLNTKLIDFRKSNLLKTELLAKIDETTFVAQESIFKSLVEDEIKQLKLIEKITEQEKEEDLKKHIEMLGHFESGTVIELSELATILNVKVPELVIILFDLPNKCKIKGTQVEF